MNLAEWAARWNIPRAALMDLRMRMGVGGEVLPPIHVSENMGSESRQQALARLDAVSHGVWLTRNNVGVLMDKRGVPVRFGLANESPAQNKQVKSADLIGIRSVVITERHVGRLFGQFVSREVKHAGWQYKGDEHEQAQRNWLNFVISKGGDAAFCTGPGSFD